MSDATAMTVDSIAPEATAIEPAKEFTLTLYALDTNDRQLMIEWAQRPKGQSLVDFLGDYSRRNYMSRDKFIKTCLYKVRSSTFTGTEIPRRSWDFRYTLANGLVISSVKENELKYILGMTSLDRDLTDRELVMVIDSEAYDMYAKMKNEEAQAAAETPAEPTAEAEEAAADEASKSQPDNGDQRNDSIGGDIPHPGAEPEQPITNTDSGVSEPPVQHEQEPDASAGDGATTSPDTEAESSVQPKRFGLFGGLG